MELSRNPFPVTFPWKVFCADNDGGSFKSERFKDVDSLDKVVSAGIGKISTFSETTKFLSEEMVFQFFMLQKWFKIFLSEDHDFTLRETSHIDQ